MGFEGIKIKVGHAGAQFGKHLRRAPAVADPSMCLFSCNAALPVHSTPPPPQAAPTDALQPITVSWATALNCLPDSPVRVNILLTAPGLDQPLMHTWASVLYADGSFTMNVLSRWWGATPSMQLWVMVIPAGSLPALQAIPAGPVITATYAEPATGKPTAADVSLNTDDKTTVTPPLGAVAQHHLSTGRTAAAVLLPLSADRYTKSPSAASQGAWTRSSNCGCSTCRARAATYYPSKEVPSLNSPSHAAAPP
ncbi:hypothetical protein C8J57DRAFT_1605037 [Mycena rebaudengoi]|nr:hypothetical protein C8J57DRAFT_1605037 [Mycena rebaudengoi]